MSGSRRLTPRAAYLRAVEETQEEGIMVRGFSGGAPPHDARVRSLADRALVEARVCRALELLGATPERAGMTMGLCYHCNPEQWVRLAYALLVEHALGALQVLQDVDLATKGTITLDYRSGQQGPS